MAIRHLFKKTGSKLMIALAGLTMMLGVGAMASSVIANNDKEVVLTKAEVYIQGPTFYFVPPDSYSILGTETFYASCYDNATEKCYIKGTEVGTHNTRKVYKFSVSSSYWINKVIFNRCSSEGEWWNKSGYINISDSYSSGYNTFVAPVTQANNDGWTSGSWYDPSTLTQIEKTTDQSPTSSTARVIFNNTGTHWVGDCAVYAWGGSASPTLFESYTAPATIYNFAWITDNDGTYNYSYGYADVPTDVTGYKIVKLSAADDYEASVSYYSDNEFTMDSVAYIRFGNSNGNYISSGGVKDDVCGSNLLQIVYAAYDTCSSSVLNGYGAASALTTNIYSHAVSGATSATVTSLNGSSGTIAAHHSAMVTRSASGSSARIISSLNASSSVSLTLWIVIGCGIAGLIGIGAAYYINKKKKKA